MGSMSKWSWHHKYLFVVVWWFYTLVVNFKWVINLVHRDHLSTLNIFLSNQQFLFNELIFLGGSTFC